MSEPRVELRWLTTVDEPTVNAVHRVTDAVVAQGGAVGWLRSPIVDDIRAWLTDWSAGMRDGRSGLVLAEVDHRVEALGAWQAGADGPLGHVVELTKVMAHPDARGLGLGRLIVEALIERARDFGAELLVLGVRGNNDGARALYESVGFDVWGVLPNGVAVGAHRFDDVRMYRQLHLPDSAVVHGSAPGGIGGSLRDSRPVDPH